MWKRPSPPYGAQAFAAVICPMLDTERRKAVCMKGCRRDYEEIFKNRKLGPKSCPPVFGELEAFE